MLEMIQILDESALLWIQDAVRVPFLDPLVEAFTSLGNTGVMWIVLSLGMLCWKPTRRAGGIALLAMALGMLCTNVVLKQLVLRPRPYVMVEGLIPLLTSADPNSFPSGHTCAACRGDGLGRSAALALGPDCRSDPGSVHGTVPALCWRPLPQ